MNVPIQVRNNRILVIDYNRSISADLRRILRCQDRDDLTSNDNEQDLFCDPAPVPDSLTFEVEAAGHGDEGLHIIEAAQIAGQPFAVAFIDVRSPAGPEAMETVAKLVQRFPELQVVLCTAQADHSWEKMIRLITRSDSLLILKKPFDSIEVLQLANALTQKWSLTHEVNGRLRDLDRLVAQRTRELQQANEKLKKEISEHIRLAGQLRQAQKMEAVGQLAAGIAHDFNNMLTVVQGNTALLLSATTPDSPDFRSLENIRMVADRGAKLVGKLLTFCRRQIVELRPTQLRDSLEAAAARLPRLQNPEIKVDVHAPPGLPMVNADGLMMETLLMNLAANAREAMPNGGVLCLTATPVALSSGEVSGNPEARPGAFVRLTVSDTGTGITPDVLPRIFEPFFTTKGPEQSAGLGLSTVYGIVKQHHGWVDVQSKVDRGTAFHIYLPAIAVKEPQPAVSASLAASAPAAKPAHGHETILVVDDEPDLQDLVAHVLSTGGYKVISANSGREALEKWARRTGDIHLLLTDIVMPDGVTGQKLASQLSAEDPRLKVIFTSGYAAGIPGTSLASIDEQNFLAKPYRPVTLLKVVRECLDRPLAAAKKSNSAQEAA